MMIRGVAVLSLLACALAYAAAGEDDWDRKMREKMVKEGVKKLGSAKAEERKDGAGYLLGYLRCEDRKYVPVLVKALKDASPEVRTVAAQTLEKLQATEAVPELTALLEDDSADVRIRAAYALGGMGTAARSAEPALKQALQRSKAAEESMVEGSMTNALAEVAGRKVSDRYKCP
jgi:HEAT repeat protein